MLKRILLVLCALLVVSALVPAAAEANDFCWQLSPFSNVMKLRFLAVNDGPGSVPRFLITGIEAVFADRAVDGAASRGVNNPGTLRMGLTEHSNTAEGNTHLECNVSIALSGGSGTYSCWRDKFGDDINGDFVFLGPGPNCPGAAPGPDIAAR